VGSDRIIQIDSPSFCRLHILITVIWQLMAKTHVRQDFTNS